MPQKNAFKYLSFWIIYLGGRGDSDVMSCGSEVVLSVVEQFEK